MEYTILTVVIADGLCQIISQIITIDSKYSEVLLIQTIMQIIERDTTRI